MWSRSWKEEIKSQHSTLSAANAEAKELLASLPDTDSTTITCDAPGEPFDAFTCVNYGGASVTISVIKYQVPKVQCKSCGSATHKTRATKACPFSKANGGIPKCVSGKAEGQCGKATTNLCAACGKGACVSCVQKCVWLPVSLVLLAKLAAAVG
jgi:hypothetical protein